MSQVYNLEPPTKGKVVLRTSLGDIDVELWPKEAPKAVRNFVQLCLEGYYDGTIFHRVIRDFMVQGGDPTSTGSGGESIYGRPFRDELHTRLRFDHRGILACANQNRPDSNGSQFFITLDRTDDLNRKYTIFGKVTGDTIYNVLRFNSLETDEDDRPAEPPRLLRADVLWNPFEDIVPRVDREAKEAAAAAEAARAAAQAKQAVKRSKNFGLVSFGDEAEEEEAAAEAAAAALKMRSAHDALEDARLSREAALEVDLDKVRDRMRAVRQAAEAAATAGGDEPGQPGTGPDFAERMRLKVQAKRAAAGGDDRAGPSGGQQAAAAAKEESGSDGEEGGLEAGSGEAPAQKRLRLSDLGRGRKSSAAAVAPSKLIRVADGELLTDLERKRQELKQRRQLGGVREKDTLARLAAFRQRLAGGGAAPGGAAEPAAGVAIEVAAAAGALEQQRQEAYAGQVRKDLDHAAYMPPAWRIDAYLDLPDADDSLESLRGHRLEFAAGGVRDAMSRTEAVDDYVVVDPLLERGKAKWSKAEQRSKKRGKEWAGRSIT